MSWRTFRLTTSPEHKTSQTSQSNRRDWTENLFQQTHELVDFLVVGRQQQVPGLLEVHGLAAARVSRFGALRVTAYVRDRFGGFVLRVFVQGARGRLDSDVFPFFVCMRSLEPLHDRDDEAKQQGSQQRNQGIC